MSSRPSSVEAVHQAVRESALIRPGTALLVMLSGGADSVCLLHVCSAAARGPVAAIHVNHGLRASAEADEAHCRHLCERLGIPLRVTKLIPPDGGNTEAWARDARYGAAEEAADREGFGLIAAGHTADDQVETILYRLACSPGRRALLGMSPQRGRIVRPLLAVSGEQTRAYCREAGLEWREDESNLDRSIARNRLRLDVIPALRRIHPAAARNMLATAAELRDEAAVLDDVAERALAEAGAGGIPPAVRADQLAQLEPALRRLVLRRLAEQAAGGPVPLGAGRVRELERLAAGGGSSSLDLGGGVTAGIEYGLIRFIRRSAPAIPDPVVLPVPGRCRFGEWEVTAAREPVGDGLDRGSLDEPLLDAAVAGRLTVRAWSDGDRMRPLGLRGTKSLQDLFTDRKVPRGLRHTLPVLESDGEIAWVAGVAVSDRFRITPQSKEAVRLKAKLRPH